MSFIHSILIFFTIIFFSLRSNAIFGIRRRHLINFQSANLYPVSLAWNPTSKRFIVSSSRSPTLLSISEEGNVKTFLSDRFLPVNSFFLGITIDPVRSRLLAIVHSHSDPFNSALAPYKLHAPHRRLFLASLHDDAASASAPSASGVAIDFFGNAMVTNSASNFIWKVDLLGRPSVFSACAVYKETQVDHAYNSRGLNGVVYNSNGYFLVSQSNTRKLYKVDDQYGIAKEIEINKELTAIDDIAIESSSAILVLSKYKLYFIDSNNGWKQATVFDEVVVDAKRSPSSVTIGGRKMYVLYGHVEEGMMGNSNRDKFSIVEIGPKVHQDPSWMVCLFVGYGSAYFIMQRYFWQ